MNGLKLVIGSRYASSWSLRPWLLLKQLGLPFEEIVIPLRQPDTALHIRRYSPSGKVPVLLVGGLRIWDSLAIAEYLAEQHPSLWPADRAARALARAVCCEMHSGFSALRTFLPMDFTARFDPPGKLLAAGRGRHRPDRRHLGRVPARRPVLGRSCSASSPSPTRCSRRSARASPPMPCRCRHRRAAYVEHMMDLPAMQEWGRLAHAELTRGERMSASLPEDGAGPGNARADPSAQPSWRQIRSRCRPCLSPKWCSSRNRRPPREPEPAPTARSGGAATRRGRAATARRHRPRCRASRRPSCGAGRGRSRRRSWSSP